jgi:hypothetical protein
MIYLVEIKENPTVDGGVEIKDKVEINGVKNINEAIDKIKDINKAKATSSTNVKTSVNSGAADDKFELVQVLNRRLKNVKNSIRRVGNILDSLGVVGDSYKRIRFTSQLQHYHKEREQLECYLFGLEKGISQKELNKLYRVVLK